jgi:hypothetical protein
MTEPAKEDPKAPKRSRRKPAMEPLGWDEIVSQPGMGGYLSFLNGPVPLPHLQTPAPESLPTPGAASPPVIDSNLVPTTDTTPVVDTSTRLETTAASETIPVIDPVPVVGTPAGHVPIPEVLAIPGIEVTPVPSTPVLETPPGVVSFSAGVSTPVGRIRIRKCLTAQDGHSLGEEVLYQALWKSAAPESGEARTIVIGWRGMSQLCRMTPKNCKINTQRLIRKLALEVLSPYNTPESIGTTYRVYSPETILRRRRAAGLEWVVRSRGVEFVDPATGVSVTAHLCGYVSD